MKLTTIIKNWKIALSFIFITLLAACNGSTTETDDSGAVVGENGQLAMALLDINGQVTSTITSGNQLTITVTFKDSQERTVEGQRIDFTSSTGTLSTSSKLTDGSGQASVSFDSSEVSAGVVTITSTTTFNDEALSVESQFEVLGAEVPVVGTPSVAITLKQEGQHTNRIRVGESAQLGVELQDQDDAPISGAVVTFTAELGTLNATSALTNANGLAEVTLTGVEGALGAALATVSVTINEVNHVKALAYEVVEADALDQSTTVLMGYFDDDNNFVDGEIRADIIDEEGNTIIGAGATLGLSVLLVDQDLNRITTPTVIEFASTCVNAGKASIDSQVTTVNGEAQATYQDISCAGAMGNEDSIFATVKVNSADLTANREVTLLPEELGSIEFISATPESIVLKGTGGEGKQETATLTFLVKGELGNPLNQQNVNFSLNTDVGGLALASDVGVTNAQGLVSVKVIAGTVPTVVRVIAKVANSDIATQSDKLTVNTGLPDQDSLTLAFSEFNPEAFNFIKEVTVSAYLADSFNNPVPDGTTVNFTTEGGSIEPSCVTINGTCDVLWNSTHPKPDDHRVTILATAEGHEYFVDANGNNVYDDDDGAAIVMDAADSNAINSGFGRIHGQTQGFFDMQEAWRDDNENNVWDTGELFIDSNSDEVHSKENGQFNGPHCTGTNCAELKFITIRKADILVMSGSAAYYRLTNATNDELLRSNYDDSASNAEITIARGDRASFELVISDSAFQTLPNDTTVTVTSTIGDLIGDTSYIYNNTSRPNLDEPAGFGRVELLFQLENDLTDDADDGEIRVTITTPEGIQTSTSQIINLL